MERFYEKVKVMESGCHEWQGALRNGYGVIKINGKCVSTHRFVFHMKQEPIPLGMVVMHSCDNKKCVNPEHLSIATQSDNMVDCSNKGRLFVPKNSGFNKGRTPKNKLLVGKEASRVKRLVKERGGKTLLTLSKELNLPHQLLRDISCGRVYRED